MSTTPKDDGGAAFPNITPDMPVVGSPGMTLRDWFAGQAMAGLAAHTGSVGINSGCEDLARRAYQLADALLSARKELARAALSKSSSPAGRG